MELAGDIIYGVKGGCVTALLLPWFKCWTSLGLYFTYVHGSIAYYAVIHQYGWINSIHCSVRGIWRRFCVEGDVY